MAFIELLDSEPEASKLGGPGGTIHLFVSSIEFFVCKWALFSATNGTQWEQFDEASKVPRQSENLGTRGYCVPDGVPQQSDAMYGKCVLKYVWVWDLVGR